MAEVTNYIDRLVAELCPDGVEYRSLGSLGKRNKGTAITASKMRSLEPGNKDLRIFAAGSTFVDTDSSNIPAKDILHGPAIIVKSRGYIGFEYYEKSFTHKNEMWSYTLDSSIADQKFIYYYLLTQAYYLQELARSKSVKLPQLSVKDTDSLEVPVPPLEIQEAIVEILDKFTNLEAELEAELEARTLQYEYYRDSLFETLDCPRNPLGSFAQYSKDRKKDDSTVSVYVGVENLKSDFQGCAPTESTNPGVIFRKGDILLGNIRPYLKKMWRADSNGVASPDVLVIRILDEFSEKISSRYLYHLLASNEFVGYNVAHSRGGKMPRGNKAKILEFEVPVPSLEEQQRIVDILDRFDALTSSLSEGLPAELAARRSQYEYYRDQLLTFPRKGENQ
ncbi:restriction endonuclease subunit S [Rothia mucilaginosa]